MSFLYLVAEEKVTYECTRCDGKYKICKYFEREKEKLNEARIMSKKENRVRIRRKFLDKSLRCVTVRTQSSRGTQF